MGFVKVGPGRDGIGIPDHTRPCLHPYVQAITARQSNTVEQVITEKPTISYVMVGPHCVNLAKVRRLEKMDPREPNEEQSGNWSKTWSKFRSMRRNQARLVRSTQH